jgi:hypothetical protein
MTLRNFNCAMVVMELKLWEMMSCVALTARHTDTLTDREMPISQIEEGLFFTTSTIMFPLMIGSLSVGDRFPTPEGRF